ncbi:hypothetical protein F5Y19DRAFT_413953 [Xylariaceae sp. FL1651]|nr:hypothetical protein F5Y19DRAFT_413953 [Xylariaceae sp. FL1651]
MATIELDELRTPAELGGSSSLAVQSTNNRGLRRRRPVQVGYDQTDHPSPEPLNALVCFREIAAAIVALNLATMKALLDGWCGTPQITGKWYERYQGFLSETEVSLVDWITEEGGARLEDEVLEYANSFNMEQARAFIVDTQTSTFYSQLVDIRIKKLRASQAHAVFAAKADQGKIPEKYCWCDSYSSYIEYAVVEEYDERAQLCYIMSAARRLLSSIKRAVEGEYLRSGELEILKAKVAALQVHYSTAAAAVQERQSDLVDLSANDWWEPPSATRSNELPSKVAKAYPGNVDVVESYFGFAIPVICLLSCIPIALAWTHSDPNVGTVADANFYQLIAGSILQVLGLGTTLYPTLFHSKLSRPSWFLTWFLAAISLIFTILSIPLYVLLPTAWSTVIAFAGTAAQPLILLQIIRAI